MGIPDCPTIIHSWFPAPTMLAAPYEATIAFAKTDVYPETGASLEDLNGRAPTKAESWITPGGNSYFFFSGTVKAEQPVHVQAGTTLDVWFPFVLDPPIKYSLTIGGADSPRSVRSTGHFPTTRCTSSCRPSRRRRAST